MNKTPAIVILSGGQDSATCAFQAHQDADLKAAVYFKYGSQHMESELGCARKTALALGIPLIELDAAPLRDLTSEKSALVGSGDVNTASIYDPALPASFVPGRNLYFFLMAAIWGVCNIQLPKACDDRMEAQLEIWTGVCETDYSGYPDCRQNTVSSAQDMLVGGLDRDIDIVTPLMYLDKADTFKMACDLGWHVLYHILEYTHTGYTGAREHRYEWGYGPVDGEALDPASLIRARGWETFKERYPNEYADFQVWLQKEGL